MKPRFSMLTLLWIIGYIAFMLAFTTSLPVVERQKVVGYFGGENRAEYTTKRRPPTTTESIIRMAALAAGIVPMVALFLVIFRPRPEYPLISLRSHSQEPNSGTPPKST